MTLSIHPQPEAAAEAQGNQPVTGMTVGDRRWLLEAARDAGNVLLLPALSEAEAMLASVPLAEAWQRAARMAGIGMWDLAGAVASRFGLELASAELLAAPQAGASMRLPPRLLRERNLRVLEERSGVLLVATSDPSDQESLQLLQFTADAPVRFCVAPPDEAGQVLAAIGVAGTAGEARAAAGEPATADVSLDLDLPDDESPGIVRLGNQMLREAVQRHASDIHGQPLGDEGVIRMRVDGVLQRVAALPRTLQLALLSRLKLLASMDPTDQTRPQDGSMRIRVAGGTADLRLATVPCDGGEKLVTRLLGTAPIGLLREAGFARSELDRLAFLLRRPQGLVLVTGPTGSGKSSTIYGVLTELNDPGTSIATVEDPIEMRLPGLAQIQVNPKTGLTFAAGLRAVLRQDPDVLLVGEIRDAETAQIAVQAAMTGHLVLASLHANDAIAALPRMLDLGVSPQLLAEALAGTTAQRLVRRLCESCAESVEIDDSDASASWLKQHAGLSALRRRKGCPACGFRGYRGRVPVAQVMEFTPDMAERMVAGDPTARLRALARQGGMRLLAEGALDLLRSGITSLEEVQRSLGSTFWSELGLRCGVPPHQLHLEAAQPSEQESDRAPVLVVAQDPGVRAMAAEAIASLGLRTIDAPDSLEGRLLLEQVGAVSSILMDISGLTQEKVLALLKLRDLLSGAAAPILALHDGQDGDSGIRALVSRHPGVFLRHRPVDRHALAAMLLEGTRVLG